MSKPIVLISPISGLSLRVKPGTAEPIPGTGRFTMKQGTWFFFDHGRYVLKDIDAVSIFGSREKAVEWLKGHRRFGRDFQIAPELPSAKSAPGAALNNG